MLRFACYGPWFLILLCLYGGAMLLSLVLFKCMPHLLRGGTAYTRCVFYFLFCSCFFSFAQNKSCLGKQNSNTIEVPPSTHAKEKRSDGSTGVVVVALWFFLRLIPADGWLPCAPAALWTNNSEWDTLSSVFNMVVRGTPTSFFFFILVSLYFSLFPNIYFFSLDAAVLYSKPRT